jgi:hypothetical protein
MGEGTRRIYTYRLIRYIPHTISDEFIYAGVFLENEVSAYRILSVDEARHLHCPFFIGDRKKFFGLVEYLNEFAQKGELANESHYFHNFRFTEARKIATDKSADEVVNEIFDDYVGYKIHSEEKIEEKKLILDRSKRLVETEFRKYIRICQSTEFDLEIENIANEIVHHSNLGRSSWKHDTSQMIMMTPTQTNPQERYDFLDIGGQIDPSGLYVQKLKHNFIDIYPYKTEEDIAKYMELVAGAA